MRNSLGFHRRSRRELSDHIRKGSLLAQRAFSVCLLMAGAEGLEPEAVGLPDRYSTN